MDIITAILVVVTCILLGLGVSVVHSNREKINRLYFINILTLIGWAITMIYYRLSSDTSVVVWTKLLYVGASLIASNFLYFSIVFPKTSYVVATAKKALIFFPNIVLVAFVLVGDLIIRGAEVNPVGENIIHWGFIYPLYVIYILFYFNLAFYILLKKFRRSSDRVERVKLGYVLGGYMFSGFVSFATNLILPSFGYFALNWVGQVSTLSVAVFVALAIVRYKLFNARVVATEFLVFTLWIILLVRTMVASDVMDIVVSGGTLVITIVLGIFLIRSVLKEILQREHIEKLAADLKKANIRLTELDRQKSEFVSFATHQLRAPLAAMKGYASLILEGDLGKLPPEAEKAVNRIFDSTNTLTSIVDDYLNIARIELGSMKYAFETIDFKTLVEDVIAELKPNIDKKPEVTLNFMAENSGTDYRTTADRDKLKQVVTNLIDNSIKYTPTGRVDVTLGLDKVKHKFILKIKDTGIGIAPETLPHLFNKFSRAENANKTNIKGTGLGLFVAKEMITAHHGTIRAESPGEGKGSTFIVELEPFAKA